MGSILELAIATAVVEEMGVGKQIKAREVAGYERNEIDEKRGAEELTGLVAMVAQAYRFTGAEHQEALRVALASPVAALESFRAIVAEQPEKPGARLSPGNPPAVPDVAIPAPQERVECHDCRHLTSMVKSYLGTRRTFWMACQRGHGLLEIGLHGERVVVAPSTCGDYEPTAGAASR
jgi:hypothetical protein